MDNIDNIDIGGYFIHAVIFFRGDGVSVLQGVGRCENINSMPANDLTLFFEGSIKNMDYN